MKATELMIGDWVLTIMNKPVQVVGLTTDCIETTEKEGFFFEDYYDPIPLTPEILEKNGFTKMDGFTNAYQWWNKNKAHSIELFFYFGGDIGGILKINIEYYNKIDMRVDYVHELQHALKLCKINKEIVL